MGNDDEIKDLVREVRKLIDWEQRRICGDDFNRRAERTRGILAIIGAVIVMLAIMVMLHCLSVMNSLMEQTKAHERNTARAPFVNSPATTPDAAPHSN